MKVAILPAGGLGLRMAVHQRTPKQLLPLRNGLVIDYALGAAIACDAWPHIILPRSDESIAKYAISRYSPISFTYGLPNLLESICVLRPIFEQADVLYVMTDTIFKPINIGNTMLASFEKPLVVGLFSPEDFHKFGMCRLENSTVVEVQDKPSAWPYKSVAWGLLAWQGAFWACLEAVRGDNMTEVIGKAIEVFGPLPSVWLDSYIDVGSPTDYDKALREGW